MLLMFMIWLIESEPTFRVMWLRRWFRVLFWLSCLMAMGRVGQA